MRLSEKSRPIQIGRKCRSLEFSAVGNLFSTSDYDQRHCENRASDVGIASSRSAFIRIAAWTFAAGFSVLLAVFAGLPVAHAQLPPLQSPPSWGQVPQGTAACSVEKSCADLAPGMIRYALGPSSLDQDARTLGEILSSASNGSSAETRAAAWAAAAFRRSGADNVHVEKFGSSATIENVVAEIRGRDYPQDYVLLVAPLDASGANSRVTAENAAVLVNAVRVIHATGSIPRRSIRFLLFGTARPDPNERLAGVWDYVRQHRADLDRIAVAIAIDCAGGSLDGYSLGDRPDALAAVQQALEPLGALDIRNFTEDVRIPSNVTPFWLAGIPTLVATASAATHSPETGKRPDSVGASITPTELRLLKYGVAIAAVSAYGLADAEARIGPRRSRTEVEQSISSMTLKPALQRAGLWSQWQAAQPGASHQPDESKSH
jgi:hypothetical protein